VLVANADMHMSHDSVGQQGRLTAGGSCAGAVSQMVVAASEAQSGITRGSFALPPPQVAQQPGGSAFSSMTQKVEPPCIFSSLT
jgi:hypothetical protein